MPRRCVSKEYRHCEREGRHHLLKKRHGERAIEHNGPGEKSHGRAPDAKRDQSEPCGAGERESARGRIQELRDEAGGRGESGNGRHSLTSFLSAIFFSPVFFSVICLWALCLGAICPSEFCLSEIFRASRSSCLRSSTALSTMPRTNCSADPPQKRSIMLFTARTATFWRLSEDL